MFMMRARSLFRFCLGVCLCSVWASEYGFSCDLNPFLDYVTCQVSRGLEVLFVYFCYEVWSCGRAAEEAASRFCKYSSAKAGCLSFHVLWGVLGVVGQSYYGI